MSDLEEIRIRNWRMATSEPSGMVLWFDPSTEIPRLFRSPPSDGDEASAAESAPLADGGRAEYLDKVRSVRGDGDGDGSLSLTHEEQSQWLSEQLGLPFGT